MAITFKEEGFDLQEMENRQLLSACIRLRKNMNALFSSGTISPGEYYVLVSLRRQSLRAAKENVEAGVKASSLSEVNGISRPAITRILNTLEDKGLIARTMSKDDRRVVLVTLTPAGLAALQQANSSLSQIGKRLVADLGEDDTQRLTQLLDKLSGIFENIRHESEKRT